MPLPDGSTAWPPKHTLAVADHLDLWSAWYSGEPDALQRAYGNDAGGAYSNNRVARQFFTQDRPGLKNFLSRWFWGSPVPVGEQRSKLHLPAASDIAGMSADLLFAEPPSITIDDASDATTERIGDYVDDGLWTSLREAAEVCAAMGGVYLRVVWDEDVRERPWLVSSPPDQVVPEWRWDQLCAATFWRVLETNDSRKVVRHLERHEPGVILHGVYEGTRDELGRRVSLMEYAETEGLAAYLDDQDRVVTGSKLLTAGYIPNIRPNRIWGTIPSATYLGRSDFSGVEGLMDALDETFSSWMRDLRLAKARLVVPQQALLSLGKGKGATFDTDQELLAGMDLGPNPDQPIHLIQFAIRMEEHKATAQELLENIIRSAGYSTQTLNGDGQAAITATEVAAKERRSLLTRGRKIEYCGPVIRNLVAALLAVDVEKFGPDGVIPDRPHLEWSAMPFVDPMDRAHTVQMLRDAGLMSVEVGVRAIHPDWDDAQVDEEVRQLQGEADATAMAGAYDLHGPAGGAGPNDTAGVPAVNTGDDTAA